jgi:CBS-domain-containing membrane protein
MLYIRIGNALIASACRRIEKQKSPPPFASELMEETSDGPTGGAQKTLGILRVLLNAYVQKVGGKNQVSPIKIAPKSQLVASLVSLAGALIGIFSVGLVSSYFSLPILIAPFGASAVLLFSVYDSPLAQPRNTLVGHILSAAIGGAIALTHVLYFAGGEKYMLEAASVAVSIFAMQILRLTHPPAGATAFLASATVMDMGSFFWFIFLISIGALILIMVAIAFNNAIPKRKYPVYW